MATNIDDDTLQRYYDGELPPTEARSLRARIEADPAARTRLSELERLGALLRMAHTEMTATLDSEALFADIERSLKDGPHVSGREHPRVIGGAWYAHRRGTVLAWTGAFAVAAAALFALLARPVDGPAEARNRPRPAEERKTALAVVESDATGPHGSHVEGVDFGANTGTVFEVESQGVKTAVVWIADDDEEDTP